MSRIETGREVYQKAEKVKPDPGYLAQVRSLPCVICQSFGFAQTSQTQAHHVIHDRFSTRKTPDRMAIPLCEGHHQGLRDTSKVALHQNPAKWKRLYGPDHEWVSATQDAILGDTE